MLSNAAARLVHKVEDPMRSKCMRLNAAMAPMAGAGTDDDIPASMIAKLQRKAKSVGSGSGPSSGRTAGMYNGDAT